MYKHVVTTLCLKEMKKDLNEVEFSGHDFSNQLIFRKLIDQPEFEGALRKTQSPEVKKNMLTGCT